jgi:transporter family protein
MNAILLAIGAGLCWGIGEVFTKSALHSKEIGPVTAIAVRSTIALPMLWLAYALAVHWAKLEPRGWMHASPATLLKIVIGSGLIAGAGGMICFYLALNLADISRIKPIAFSIAPALAVIIGWLVLREGMTVQKALGVALILAGVVLLTGRAGSSTGRAPGKPQPSSVAFATVPPHGANAARSGDDHHWSELRDRGGDGR